LVTEYKTFVPSGETTGSPIRPKLHNTSGVIISEANFGTSGFKFIVISLVVFGFVNENKTAIKASEQTDFIMMISLNILLHNMI
jgi:hypothetical protein